MRAQKGKDLLLKVGDGRRVRHRRRAAQQQARLQCADSGRTDAEVGRTLARASSAAAACSGVRLGHGHLQGRRQRRAGPPVFFEGAIGAWQVVVPGFGTVSGPFQVPRSNMPASTTARSLSTWRWNRPAQSPSERCGGRPAGRQTAAAARSPPTSTANRGPLPDARRARRTGSGLRGDNRRLAERFSSGRLRPPTYPHLGAGLRGGGNLFTDDEVAAWRSKRRGRLCARRRRTAVGGLRGARGRANPPRRRRTDAEGRPGASPGTRSCPSASAGCASRRRSSGR